MKDFGYDISDFLQIQPEYGTMKDFERMTTKCDELGIRLILDFVPNHTYDLCHENLNRFPMSPKNNPN